MYKFLSPSFHPQFGFNVALRPRHPQGIQACLPCKSLSEADFVTVWLGFVKVYWTQAETLGRDTSFFNKISWTGLDILPKFPGPGNFQPQIPVPLS